MEQVAILEYQQQEELEYLIYGAAFLLADVGLFQEPAYTEFLELLFTCRLDRKKPMV